MAGQQERGQRGPSATLRPFAVLLLLAWTGAAGADAPAVATVDAPPVSISGTPPAGPSAQAIRRLADRRAWEGRRIEDRQRNAALFRRVLAQEDTLEGLELLVATAPPDAPLARRWGHALLRFVAHGGDPLDDVVLGLVAVPDSPRISYWAGLTGGYPLAPELGTMTWALQTFVRDQDRPLTRWALPSTAAQRHALLRDLAARSGFGPDGASDGGSERGISGEGGGPAPHRNATPGAQRTRPLTPVGGPSGFGGYTFAGNNCARGLVDRLVDAGMVEAGDAFATHIPSQLGRALAPVGGPLQELPAVPGLGALYARAGEHLGIPMRDVRRGAWPSDTGALSSLPVADRLALLWTVEMAPPAAREALLASLPPPDARPSLAEVFGVTTR